MTTKAVKFQQKYVWVWQRDYVILFWRYNNMPAYRYDGVSTIGLWQCDSIRSGGPVEHETVFVWSKPPPPIRWNNKYLNKMNKETNKK